MTKTAEIEELTQRLPEFLEAVRAGDEIVIRRGREDIARLVPPLGSRRRPRRSVRQLKPLPGKWTGEAVWHSGDLAEEMFARR